MAAVLLLALGILYLLCGWYMFKVLLTFNATLVGALLGALIGRAMGSTAAGALLGAFVTAVIAWPLMKHTVAITGALFGAVLGASLWLNAGLDERYVAAGAAIGMTFFGLLSFILFRSSVVLYTSFQGSVMGVLGLLGLIYKVHEAAPHVSQAMTVKPFVLPMILFVLTIIGLLFQQTHYPTEAPKK